MASKQVDFGSEHVAGSIVRTALPLLVAQVLTLLYSIVDRIYIARIPGEGTASIAGLGLCFPIIIIITAFTNLVGMGGAPLFAIERGKGDKEKAAHIMSVACLYLILFGITLMILCLVFAEPILTLFGTDDSSMPYALNYIRIYLIGTIPVMLTAGLNPYINSMGFPRVGMVTIAIGAVTNIVLDPVFIFVCGMGISGAAIATVLSQTLSMIFVLWFLNSRNSEYRLRVIPPRIFRQTLPLAGEIMSLGVSPFIMQVTNSLVSIACNNVLMHFGGAMFVSVYTIISSVRQILDTPAMAITEGSSPVISFNYGAGNGRNLRKAIVMMASMAIGYTFVIWLLIEVDPTMFIKIFTDDEELIKAAAYPLHLYFFAFVFQSFQYSGQTVFKALNKKKQAIFFSLLRKVILVVPLTYLLPYGFGMGTNGVFIAEPISNVIGGLASFLTMIITIFLRVDRILTKDKRKS